MSGKETLEIIQGISQAVANAFDGNLDKDGKPIQIGLKREEQESVFSDKKLFDGFSASMSGNILKILYHGQILVKDAHEKDFEKSIIELMDNCVSFLKKEYKKVTGKTLKLTQKGEHDIKVEYMNRVRSWAIGTAFYEIGGIEKEEDLGDTVEKRLSSSFKKWLGI